MAITLSGVGFEGSEADRKAFLDRPIEGDWPYLWMDATYIKVRRAGRIVSVAVIIAVGVNSDGRREVLGMAIGHSEAEVFWTEFLRSLARRGLRGVKLVISDSHEGIKASVAKVFSATWQRCRVHFMRNALAHAGKSGRRVVSAFIATAFAQETPEAAKAQWRSVADQLRPTVPKLAALMDSAEEDVLAYMTFPAQHRTKLHSNNPIERLNGEIKRRTDVVGIFPNEDAITRLVGAILLEQNDVYGPPPPCKAFQQISTISDLAVVYPALLCGITRRRPLWFPRIDGRTNGRTQIGSHHFSDLCRSPVIPVRHTLSLPSQVGAITSAPNWLGRHRQRRWTAVYLIPGQHGPDRASRLVSDGC